VFNPLSFTARNELFAGRLGAYPRALHAAAALRPSVVRG
jgi:hypothetical protein